MLYIRNERFVVLLNNVRSGADLGALKAEREDHIEPEADLLIIPTAQVLDIGIMKLTDG